LTRRWVISRYTSVSWTDGRIRIASAASGAVLETADLGLVRLVHAFAEPATEAEVIAILELGVPSLLEARMKDLMLAGILVPAGGTEPAAAEHWDAAALAFQRAARVAGPPGQPAATGGAATVGDALAPIPLRAPPSQPDALWSALRARASCRDWSDAPIALADFARLLSWSAAVRDLGSAAGSRPYPSGGALHSLDLHPVLGAGAVEGLGAGIHRFDPSGPAIVPLAMGEDAAAPLLDCAGYSVEGSPPPVLLVITSRVRGPSAKYGPLGYDLVLKEVGGLYQTLHLVAARLGLAGCALGGAASAGAFRRACGGADLSDPVVGEFALGLPAPERDESGASI
jgi:SagB-type dehydrogenase family enzyme